MDITEIQKLNILIDELLMMIDTVPVQMWFLTDIETYGRVNLHHAEFLGMKKEDIEFKKLEEFLPGDIAMTCKQSNREVFESRNTVYSEEWLYNSKGEKRLIAITKTPEFDKNRKEIEYIICFGNDITESKRTEELLADEQWRMKSIIKGTNIGTWEWNVQTGETIFNKRWAQIAGYTLDELRPISIKTWENLVHPEDMKKSKELLERHFSGELKYYDCECRMKHKDGHWVWVHDRGQVITHTDDGRPLMMFGTHTDITKRKEAEQKLQDNEKLLQIILSISNSFITIAPDAVDDGIQQAISQLGEFGAVDRCYVFLFDDRTEISISNTHEWCADGIESQKYNLQTVPSGAIPWWMARLRANEVIDIQRVEDLPPEASLEKEILEVQSIKSVLVVPISIQNRLIGFLGFDSVRQSHSWPKYNITLIRMMADILANALERKRTETMLVESEENYRTFFETIGDMIFVSNTEGQIVYANSATSQKLGYSLDELRTMHIIEMHPQSSRDEAVIIVSDMLCGKRNTCPLPLANKNGSIIPVETRIWFGKWSGVNCMFSISKDLTKEQDALQKFDKLFRMNPALMSVTRTIDRTLVDINDAFLNTLGYSKEELTGKTSKELKLFADAEELEHMIQMIVEHRSIREFETKLKTKDGRIREGLISGDIIESQGERYFLAVMIDITDRKKAEAEREKNIQELKKAIAEIKTLKGFIPICASCKKIRNDKGYWEQVEAYVTRHTEARFSHGICPECVKKLYSDFSYNDEDNGIK